MTWGPSIPACPADDYQLSYERVANNLGESCPVSDDKVTLSWRSVNSRTLNNLNPSSTYSIVITPRRGGEKGDQDSARQTTKTDGKKLLSRLSSLWAMMI